MLSPTFEQLRFSIAGHIIATLERDELTFESAEKMSGIPAADFSKIRRGKIKRLTIEYLLKVLSALGEEFKISVNVCSRQPTSDALLLPEYRK